MLALIPAAFLAALGGLFFARTTKVQIGSAIILAASTSIVALIPAVLHNYGAAWGGRSQVGYTAYLLMGFVGGLVFSLSVIGVRRKKAEAQRGSADQLGKASDSIDSPK